MLLNIKHTSRYQYDYPVQYAVQRLRLQPSSSPGQKVIDWNVTVSGAEQEASYRDGYGNRTQLVRLDRDVKELVIEATGQVETEDRSGVLGKVYNFMPIWLYERETELTKPGDAIKQLAASLKVTNDRLAVMHELMTTLHKVVAYTPGTTNITTTAEEALTLGTGVCQDHTHVFLAVARVLKIPARYVSGYLMMLDSIEQTATHAWAEAHIDGLGWVGFDAANDICPNEHYIRVACGLDYNEASPISGMRFGPGMESLAVDLNVEQ